MRIAIGGLMHEANAVAPLSNLDDLIEIIVGVAHVVETRWCCQPRHRQCLPISALTHR